MSAHEACHACGTTISTDFARVFGNNTDDAHACLHCATSTAIHHGAATSPSHDGTPLVYIPGRSDPQPVTSNNSPEQQSDRDPVHLEDLRARDHTHTDTTNDDFSHTDSSFEALVAE